ncbi:GAF domain-containing protein [Streptomyces sp. NPDC001393]|uniref:GAF domain-containing protein n=1 Tax=Streptomyces sp. NPDC001817 TaxID=3154398 RepID=UPI00331CD5EC
MQTGKELADLAVPVLADYVTVDLAAEPVPFGVELPVDTSPDGERLPALRRAGAASIHPGAPESPWARAEKVPFSPTSPITRVMRTGRSHLEPVLDTSAGTWLDRDSARARWIRENGMHSLMIVPIRARRSVLGVAVFVRTKDPVPFQEDDLLLAEELVTRAALCLDNAHQYACERTAALALQRHLLPSRLRGGVAVDVASRYLPADTDAGVSAAPQRSSAS